MKAADVANFAMMLTDNAGALELEHARTALAGEGSGDAYTD